MIQETTYTLVDYPYFKGNPGWTSFMFGCLTEPTDDGKVYLLGKNVRTCREEFCRDIRERINSNGATDQPMDKTRVLFVWGLPEEASKRDDHNQETLKSWLERGVSALHSIEKLAGWPLTRVYKVKTENDERYFAYYFHSSRRWMKAPYLMSLYVLAIRMCIDSRIKDFQNFDELEKLLIDLTTLKDGDVALKNNHDCIKPTINFWRALMLGYPRLFRKKKMPYYWSTDRLGGDEGFNEGLTYLAKGHTRYDVAKNELWKIEKELKSGEFKP